MYFAPKVIFILFYIFRLRCEEVFKIRFKKCLRGKDRSVSADVVNL